MVKNGGTSSRSEELLPHKAFRRTNSIKKTAQIFLLTLAALLALTGCKQGLNPTASPSNPQTAATAYAAPSHTVAPGSSPATAAKGVSTPLKTSSSDSASYTTIDPQNGDPLLMVVDLTHRLPAHYKPKLSFILDAQENYWYLDSRAAPHYNDMYRAAKQDGITLRAVSPYRSVSLQKTLFERKVSYYKKQGYSESRAQAKAATIVLPPGASEHNAGLSIDILSLEQNFDETAAFRWLDKNAHTYGFILRYPKGKQSITGVIYEPWHWRYVGIQNAESMKTSGLCLEEYVSQK